MDCWHIIAHPTTGARRQDVIDNLEYCRRVGDIGVVPLLLLQLGNCSFRDVAIAELEGLERCSTGQEALLADLRASGGARES